ncbi:hypothetical protein [Devosia sp. 2618]|uniref:hypothetical protein n=1 Tax=Devosia sp. 2618 TaxID=3156454 RepID=UPI003396E8AB
MNTANLQLEGLLMAVAAVNQALVVKGVLTTEELDHTLAVTEQTAMGDDRMTEDMAPANRDAVLFPVRLLRIANNMAGDRDVPPFAELAKMVGETKGRYNDQE